MKLDDCGHIIESEGLEYWLRQTNDGQIQMKRCPRCQQPVYNTSRYKNIILNTYKDVQAVLFKHAENTPTVLSIVEKMTGRLNEGKTVRRMGTKPTTRGAPWAIYLYIAKTVKGRLHEQIKLHKFFMKPGFVKQNRSVQCLSLRREGVSLFSNGSCSDGMFYLRYICHGCGNNKVQNDRKPM